MKVAGVVKENREKRCRILRTMTKDIKAGKLEALSKHHKKNMKTEFSAETFTKECRTTG